MKKNLLCLCGAICLLGIQTGLGQPIIGVPYRVPATSQQPSPNIQHMVSGDVTSDFGRRNCVQTEWHKGVDFSPEPGNTDAGYELLAIEGGIIKWIYQGPSLYKFIAINNSNGNKFGYAHIFENVPNATNGQTLANFTFKAMKPPNHNRWAIIYHPPGGTIVAICSDWYSMTPEVEYMGITYPCSIMVTQNQPIAPLGNSGNYDPAQGTTLYPFPYHLHLHSFRQLLNQQNMGYPISLSNCTDPLEFIPHQQPNYLLEIIPLAPITNQSPGPGQTQMHFGDLDNTIYVSAEMQNAGGSGYDCDQIYNNAVMNLDNVSLKIKGAFEAPSQFDYIRGPYYESRISHGARISTTAYPDIIYSQSGDIGTTGIKPYAYGLPGSTAPTPKDEFYFADFVPRIHRNDALKQNNAQMAIINGDALYPDGQYNLMAEIETVIGNPYSSPQKDIIIDNFRPYIQKVEISSNNQIITSAWQWNGINNTFSPATGLIDPNYNVIVRITSSEPMTEVSLSIPDLTYNQISTSSVANSGDMVWEFTLTSSQLLSINPCTLPVAIDGLDYVGNPVESNPQHIPIRQSGTSWLPLPNPGPDTHHSIYLSGNCGTPPPQCTDTYEPNNNQVSAMSAFPAWGASNQTASINSYVFDAVDEDFFTVQLSGNGTLTIDLSNLPDDYDMELLDALGVPVVPAANSTGNSAEQIVYPYNSSSPVTLFIKVKGKAGAFSTCSPYTLSINWVAGNGCADTFEPNDLASSAANSFPVLYNTAVNITLNSYLFTSTDEDVFQLGFDGTGTLTLTLSNLPFDYSLELLDFDGTTVISTSNNPGIQNEQLIYNYNTFASTIRYARVKSPTGAFDPCIAYTLDLDWIPTPGCVDNFEPNNTAVQAPAPFPALALSPFAGSLTSAVFAPGDIDIFEIELTEPGVISVDLTSLPANYDLFFLDTDGVTVLNSSTQAGLVDEQFSFPYPSSVMSTYFIKVEGNGNVFDECNQYALNLNWSPNGGCIPPQVPSPLSPGTLSGPGTILNDLTPTFDWVTDPNATNYELAVSKYPYGSSNLVFDMCVPGPPFTLPSAVLAYGEKYRWDVQANYNCGTCESPISYERYFQTNQPVQSYCNGLTTLSAPGGVFYDGSGLNLYQNNSDCQWLIQTPGASSIELSFLFFSTELGADLVTIYDGGSVNDPVLGVFSGDSLPPIIQSSGEEMLVSFTSNGNTQDWGWFASYQARYGGIASYEYWFDVDYSSKVSVSSGALGDFELNTSLPTTGLEPGLHSFHIRFQDDQNAWSSALSQYFHKLPVAPGARNITTYEYWFDDDYTNKVVTAASGQAIHQMSTPLDATSLTPGLHTFHVRYQDDGGQWSSVLSQYFQKMPLDQGYPNLITAYRYWFNLADTTMVTISLPVPVNPYEMVTDIDATSLPVGTHTVHFQFQDTLDYWSSVLTDTFQKVPEIFPAAVFSANNTLICLNDPVSFSNTSANANTWLWDFGDGNNDNGFSPNHVYAGPGLYSVSLIATDSTTGRSDTLAFQNYVQVLAVPQLNPIAPASICLGTSTALSTGGADTYSWSPANGLNTTTGSSVQASPAVTTLYTVIGTNSCGADTTTVLVSVQSLNNSFQVNDATCGNANGNATAIVTGGTGPYTYLWSTGDISAGITNQLAGAYTLTITDANGCTLNESVVINNLGGPSVNLSGTNAECANNDGSAIAAIAGGIPPYSILWTNGDTTAALANLPAGAYSVTVTDANGCATTESLTITAPPAVQVVATADAQVDCFGAATGAASAAVSGGSGGLVYTWSNGLQGASISGLIAGAYTVIATDAAGCSDTASITINEPAELTTQLTITSAYNGEDISCLGAMDGAVNATTSGGTSTYTYNWSNGQTGPGATGLGAGNISVITTDNKGCLDTTAITLSAPPEIVAQLSSTPIVCNGDSNATITVAASGGTGMLTYLWNTLETTPTLLNMGAGTYSLTVSDANACTVMDSLTLLDPPALQLSATVDAQVDCFGGATGAASGIASGGTGAIAYSWSNGMQGSAISGLIAGTYTLISTDAEGCTDTTDVTLTEPAQIATQLAISSDYNGADISCMGEMDGIVEATVSGGTQGYTYQWSNGENGPTADSVGAGLVSVIITDANGCMDTASAQLVAPPEIVLQVTPTDASCLGGEDGAVNATASGGTGSLTYLWDMGDTTTLASNLAAGTYSLTVTDANGCVESEQGVVQEGPALPINLGPDQTVCQTTSLMSPLTGGSYLWSTGDTSQTVQIDSTGTYILTFTDANQCQGSDTVMVLVEQPPIAGFQFDLVNDSTVSFTTINSLNASQYLWDFGDGNSSPAPNPNHTYSSNGTYAVTLIVSNETCGSDTLSQTILVGPTDLDPALRTMEVSVVPNPNSGVFTVGITGAGLENLLGLELHNSLGQVVYQKELALQRGALSHTINMEQLASGVYYLELTIAGQKRVEKVEVVH